jgi:ribosome recycling factor
VRSGAIRQRPAAGAARSHVFKPVSRRYGETARALRRAEADPTTETSMPELQTLEGVYKDTEARMNKAIESTRSEFASIRTGRATPSLLDRLQVEAYGSSVPLKQVASVSSPDGRSLQVSAFDKNLVGAIRKAIETSDLGLNPNVDGQTIRLSIPPLNEERRKALVKIVKGKGEDGKVAVRNIRHKATDEIKALLKAGTITEDEVKRAGDQVQKLTDRHIKQIDELVTFKEKEIMEV